MACIDDMLPNWNHCDPFVVSWFTLISILQDWDQEEFLEDDRVGVISVSMQFRATIGPPTKRHLMAFRWWADGGLLLHAHWDYTDYVVQEPGEEARKPHVLLT